MEYKDRQISTHEMSKEDVQRVQEYYSDALKDLKSENRLDRVSAKACIDTLENLFGEEMFYDANDKAFPCKHRRKKYDSFLHRDEYLCCEPKWRPIHCGAMKYFTADLCAEKIKEKLNGGIES